MYNYIIILFLLILGGQSHELVRQDYGFWQGTSSNGVKFPATLEATDTQGNVFEKTLNSIEGGQIINF